MTWDALQMYREGLRFFTAVIDGFDTTAWERQSPCDGWRALDVLGHVGAGNRMGITILRGEPFSFERVDPPGSVVGADPAAWWLDLAADVHQAIASVDDLEQVVDSPMGPRTIREGLSFPAADLFFHGWDLTATRGGSVDFPDEAIAFIQAMFKHVPDEVARRPGVFAAARDTSPDASPTEAILAFAGRDPGWRPPT